jgi:hypothetical protein
MQRQQFQNSQVKPDPEDVVAKLRDQLAKTSTDMLMKLAS